MKLAELYQQVTRKIVMELQQGVVPWVRPWKHRHVGGLLPQNFATGRPYSGINIPILWGMAAERGYERHQWLTYKQAQALKAQVKKGEHGPIVVFTKKLRVGEEDEQKLISMLRTYTVFNVAQVDGLTFEDPAPLPEPERDANVERFVEATHADIRYGGNQAMYVPSRDYVAMPPAGAFQEIGSFYCTELHELSHWTAHEKRLNRDLKNRFATKAYAAEELIAELSAAFLCAHLGVEGELRHAGYIADWITLLRDDDRAIFTAAAKASQAADFLRQFSETVPTEETELAA